MASKQQAMSKREAAEAAYNEALADVEAARERARTAKRALDEVLITEQVAALNGLDPETLEGEALEAAKVLARARMQAGAVARADLVAASASAPDVK